MTDAEREMAALAKTATPVPGGCDACDAYRILRITDCPWIFRATVHHEDDCPVFAEMLERAS
jgi:hypothetical protein